MIVKRKLERKLKWFPEARFGMFVHFGVYALLGRGEWVMYREDIPREEYAKLMRRFNPHRFNADEWVNIARRGGARYITITAKHHDGFCLFDSALTDYKITNTPFGRDLIGELVEACRRKDMRICLYYSQPDWHHPNFVHRKGAFKDLQYDRPDDDPDWSKYVEYYHAQVEELCTKYGRIDGIWFDGVHKTEREWQGRKLYRMIKKHQPAAVVNERAGLGDFFTPERRLSFQAAAAGYTVESCQAICRETWGYNRNSTHFSSPYLIECLVRMAAGGGNYLLNVGPKPDGTLPEEQVQRLYDIGDWLKVYGKAIYGTEGCPLLEESDEMVYTRRGRTVYLHLLRWPEADAIELAKLRRPPRRARVLKSNTRLRIEADGDTVILKGLPTMPPEATGNVVEMTFDREPIFRPLPGPAPAPVLTAAAGKALVLHPDQARVRGFGPKGSVLQVKRESDTASTFAAWSSPEQKAMWPIECARPIRCEVSVEMSCDEQFAGTTFRVRAAGQALDGTVPGGRRVRVKMGTIDLPAGETKLTLAPDRMNYGYIFANIHRVIFRPIR